MKIFKIKIWKMNFKEKCLKQKFSFTVENRLIIMISRVRKPNWRWSNTSPSKLGMSLFFPQRCFVLISSVLHCLITFFKRFLRLQILRLLDFKDYRTFWVYECAKIHEISQQIYPRYYFDVPHLYIWKLTRFKFEDLEVFWR